MAAMSANSYVFSVRRSGSLEAAETFTGEFVSGNYFSTFGLRPYRPVADSTGRPGGAPPALVISYRAWQGHYGLIPQSLVPR